MSLWNIPDYLGEGIVAAVGAAGGFLARSILDLVRSARGKKQRQLKELVQLRNLLDESWETFATQNRLARRLVKQLRGRIQREPDGIKSWEDFFTKVFDDFTEEERDIHAVIRGITKNSMFAVNRRMKEWCERNDDIKAGALKASNADTLSTKIKQMEHHLNLWFSKYHVWIEGHENHVLVYLDDEHHHGVGFPKEIKETVNNTIEELS
jgi:hypothetical protein